MNKIKISVILFALLVIGGAEVNALPTLINSFHATNVWGNQAPPEYALRLDGFFDGNSLSEVTFGFDNVLFDQFDDGTARLHGVVSVVEFNGSTVNSFVGLSYDLNVKFSLVTDPSDISKIANFDLTWDYYNIDPTGVEMVSKTDIGDFANLWTYPAVDATVLKPFRVGTGANGKNQNYGAAGWLSYEHQYEGGLYGQNGSYSQSSDFLMNLTPVPEPATVLLFGIGLAGAGIRRRFKKQ